MSNLDIKTWAYAYVEAGYGIMPLVPETKRAARKGEDLGGLRNPVRTIDDVDKVWNGTLYGIGLPLGKINNVIALDVDYDDGCRADFINGFDTYITKTGSDNHHVFFRPGDIQIKNGLLIEKGVTLKSDGSYVAMPPTIHDVTKKPYLPLREKFPLFKSEILDLPDFHLHTIRAADPETQKIWQKVNNRILMPVEGEIPQGMRRPQLFREAGFMRARNWKADEILSALRNLNGRCNPPLSESDLIMLANGVLRYSAVEETYDITLYEARQNLIVSDKGRAIHNVDNVLRLLENWSKTSGKIWFDEFHQKIRTNWNDSTVQDWSDKDTSNLTCILQRYTELIKVPDNLVAFAVNELALRNKKNEPKEWLDWVSWDGQERMSAFFNYYCGAEDSEYSKAIAHNFWLSLVARVYSPGCKLDNMVILEGTQGIGKSRMLSIVGGEWYGESYESIQSKDFPLSLQGKMVIEISELDAFSKVEANTIKKILSMGVDRFRPPYGRMTQSFPRSCVFVGTTNDDNYLKDPTGNRRFWPIRVDEFKLDEIARDREQLFAEAVHRYKSGESWHEVPWDAAKLEQDARVESDLWEEMVQEYIIGKDEVKSTDVLRDAIQLSSDRWTAREYRRLGRIFRQLGWSRRTVRKGERTMKLWVRRYSKFR